MNRCLTDLCNLLDLEKLEDNLFRGQSRDLGGKSVFGGQVISQALVAATRTRYTLRRTHQVGFGPLGGSTSCGCVEVELNIVRPIGNCLTGIAKQSCLEV